ncbi:hypothetical protein ACFL0W_04895 [Nanoarchaeota archaeon]
MSKLQQIALEAEYTPGEFVDTGFYLNMPESWGIDHEPDDINPKYLVFERLSKQFKVTDSKDTEYIIPSSFKKTRHAEDLVVMLMLYGPKVTAEYTGMVAKQIAAEQKEKYFSRE